VAVSLNDADESGAPPYRKIADALRVEIGDLQPGTQLPTQAALVRRFNVTRSTIQRALDELRDAGLIDSQQGRGSFVKERTRDPSLPGPAGIRLVGHLEAAFRAPQVTIDVFSLTSQTLLSALQRPLELIRSGELRPESVALRLLLPALTAQLAVPRLIADAKDERPLRRLRRLVDGHAISVRSAVTGLQDLGLVANVTVEIKQVPITPVHKLYLLNGTEALFGYYEVVERPVSYSGEELDIYDVLGLGATLFHFSAEADTADSQAGEFVARSRRWFDSVWSTIAEPWEA
jgi:DNA-binding transcriptional ArsR family regulator